MKSLSSMASSQPRSLGGKNSSSSRRWQAIRSCLPIVVTAILVIFLGGFPPTTWVLLFQTLGQLKSLLTYQGPGVILPLIILIVQSLLLAIAWALLGWVILREGTYLMTMQSKAELDRLLAFQSTAGELINPSQMVTKQLPLEQDFDGTADALEEEQDYRVITDALEEMQDYRVTTDALEEEQDYRMVTAPLRRAKEIDARTAPLRRAKEIDARTAPLRRAKEIDARTAPLRRAKAYGLATVPLGVTTGRLGVTTGRLDVTTSPLIQEEAEEDSWASRGVQSRRVQLPSVPSRSIESRSVSVQPRGMQLPSVQSRRGQTHDLSSRTAQLSDAQTRGVQSRTAQLSDAQTRNVPSRTAQLSDAQTRGVQSRTVQPSRVEPDNVQSRNPRLRGTSSSRRGLSTGHLQEEDLLENPFDKELPPTPETDDNVKQVRNRMVTKKEELPEEDNEEEDDNPFVFGNPFDGPLPDVFRYDADLRRSVMDMLEEDVPQSNGLKAKEDRAQKTKHL